MYFNIWRRQFINVRENEGTIKTGQFRDSGNIRHKTQNEDKQAK